MTAIFNEAFTTHWFQCMIGLAICAVALGTLEIAKAIKSLNAGDVSEAI